MKPLIAACIATVLLAFPARAEVDIQEVTSPGGITAWLVEEHSIPFTALEIRFRGGASLDAPGKRGAINLMTAILEEGAGDYDSQGYSEAREALAAGIKFDVYNDSLTVSARFLTENRQEAAELLRLALTQTHFEQQALDRVRGQVLANIRSDALDPGRIASMRFDALAFGDHPYGTSQSGTLDSVAALTQDDMFAARDSVIARDRLFVGAVGDITPQDLGLLLDSLMADLPDTGAAMPEEIAFALDGGITVVPFATPQSVAVFGHVGITQDDDDFFPAYVMNQILGSGNFSSRLMEEVRAKRGLTYGISTHLVPMDYAQTIQGQVASANERIAQAIDVVKDEWARMAQGGVTMAELTDAKTFLTGAYPLRFDGNAPIARILVGMQMQGLPIDYIPGRNAKVDAVTQADVARVAKRLLDANALHFVVVGEPEGLQSTD